MGLQFDPLRSGPAALLARLAQRKGRVFWFAAVFFFRAVENEAIAEKHPMVNQQLP